MGHVALSVARRLTEQGLVRGLKFDKSVDEGTFRESCMYVKATRKPIAKEREGERHSAIEVGTLMHSNVWGPSPVTMLGG